LHALPPSNHNGPDFQARINKTDAKTHAGLETWQEKETEKEIIILFSFENLKTGKKEKGGWKSETRKKGEREGGGWKSHLRHLDMVAPCNPCRPLH
jgi:hypothetical protein